MTRPCRAAGALLLLLPLAACGGAGAENASRGSGTQAAAGPADAQTATVTGTPALTFSPSTLTAAPGQLTLTLRVDGGVPHDLIFQDSSVGAPIPVTSTTGQGTYTFSRPGTYTFVCDLHPGMRGQVVVTAS